MVVTSLPPTHREQREDEPGGGVKTKAEEENKRETELRYLSADLCCCGLFPENREERCTKHISESWERFICTVTSANQQNHSCRHASSELKPQVIERIEGTHIHIDVMMVRKCNTFILKCELFHSFFFSTHFYCLSELWKIQRALEMVIKQHINWNSTGQKRH